MLKLSVAIKILHPHKACYESRERFFQASKKLEERKEGVVTVLNPRLFGDGVSYFVMELIKGRNLEDAVVR